MKTEELLSADVTTELARLMTRKYATHVRDRTFSIIAKQEFDEVTAVVTLSNPKETFYYPVEALMNFVEQEMKPAEAALEPTGPTHVMTGTGDARIASTMSRIESIRPPGVSSRSTTARALMSFAWFKPSLM